MGESGVKRLRLGEDLGERSLTTAGLLFHFFPTDCHLWLERHDPKAEKENLCPVSPMGLGRARQQPCESLGRTVALFGWQR